MDEPVTHAAELAFRFGAVVPSALIAGAVALFVVMAMLAVMPTRFPANPLYLVGSAFSIETTAAYLWGLLAYFGGALGFGCVVAAVLVGFEVERFEFAWGIGAGIFLALVSGTTLAYARTLNRAVRAGLVSDPAPFLLRYGKGSAAQLVLAHALFGAVAGQLYVVFV